MSLKQYLPIILNDDYSIQLRAAHDCVEKHEVISEKSKIMNTTNHCYLSDRSKTVKAIFNEIEEILYDDIFGDDVVSQEIVNFLPIQGALREIIIPKYEKNMNATVIREQQLLHVGPMIFADQTLYVRLINQICRPAPHMKFCPADLLQLYTMRSNTKYRGNELAKLQKVIKAACLMPVYGIPTFYPYKEWRSQIKREKNLVIAFYYPYTQANLDGNKQVTLQQVSKCLYIVAFDLETRVMIYPNFKIRFDEDTNKWRPWGDTAPYANALDDNISQIYDAISRIEVTQYCFS